MSGSAGLKDEISWRALLVRDEDIRSVGWLRDCASLSKNTILACRREKRSQIVTGRRKRQRELSRVLRCWCRLRPQIVQGC